MQINFREEDKSQLTIFYGGKVLVFNDFPADKAKGLMQLAGKGSPVVQNDSATTTVMDTAKVQTAALAPASSLPSDPVDAHKSARPNASGNYPVIYCSYPLGCLTCASLVLIVLIIDKIFSVL